MIDSSLAEARDAINALPRSAFTELMAYHKPPKALALVCESALLAVAMHADHGWVDVQREIIANPAKFKKAVLELEPVDIDHMRRNDLSERLSSLANADMENVSKLGAALKSWLEAVVPRK